MYINLDGGGGEKPNSVSAILIFFFQEGSNVPPQQIQARSPSRRWLSSPWLSPFLGQPSNDWRGESPPRLLINLSAGLFFFFYSTVANIANNLNNNNNNQNDNNLNFVNQQNNNLNMNQNIINQLNIDLPPPVPGRRKRSGKQYKYLPTSPTNMKMFDTYHKYITCRPVQPM